MLSAEVSRLVGSARCADRAAFSGARWRGWQAARHPFRPLDAGGDIAARCPYQRLAIEIPRRKRLPHEIPSWVDPQNEIYFVTINCQERFRNRLALPDISERLFRRW